MREIGVGGYVHSSIQYIHRHTSNHSDTSPFRTHLRQFKIDQSVAIREVS